MARNITYEPCTLVYTLLNPKKLEFADFSLIVRSLHSFQVESITPMPDVNSIHVSLNYQASINNAMNKLGSLRSIIGISKLSSHVNHSEYVRLEQLRQKYGIASSSDGQPDASACYIPPSRGQFKQQRRGVFTPRPAPYKKKGKSVPTFSTNVCEIYESAETPDEDGEQVFPEETQPLPNFEQYVENYPGHQ